MLLVYSKTPAIDATTKIRPIIIISFGTSVVMLNGVTFGAGIGIGSCHAKILFHLLPYPNKLQMVTDPRT